MRKLLLGVLLLTVQATISLGLLIGQTEDVRQFLLDRGDAARVLALDDIDDLLRQSQSALLHDLVVTDDIDCDVVIDVTEYVEVDVLNRSLDLDDVLATHLVASCILDDCDLTVELVKTKMIVDIQTLSSLNVIQNNAFA